MLWRNNLKRALNCHPLKVSSLMLNHKINSPSGINQKTKGKKGNNMKEKYIVVSLKELRKIIKATEEKRIEQDGCTSESNCVVMYMAHTGPVGQLDFTQEFASRHNLITTAGR